MRLFIAITPPPEVRRALGEAVEMLRRTGADVKWVAPENLHLTLKFLGHVDESRVPELEAALLRAASGCPPFDVTVAQVGAFPPHGRPRVVWMGCDPRAAAGADSPLRALQQAVEAAVDALGFPPEERSFSGHFTLGRVRSPRGEDRLVASLKELRERGAGEFHVEHLSLIESRLSPHGPTYRHVADLPLRHP